MQETLVGEKPKYWDYRCWEIWREHVYADTLNTSHFYDDGKLHQQDFFWTQGENEKGDIVNIRWRPSRDEDLYYLKLVKGNMYYIVPKSLINKLPLTPTATKQIRLDPKNTTVWHFITDADSLYIPEKKNMSFRETIDTWNPREHSNEMTWKFLKMLALSKGNKLAICGETASGKNANITLMSSITGKYIKISKPPTIAKLYMDIYNNDFINIDEITSWTKSKAIDTEDMATEMADDTPNMNKFSLASNRMLESIGIDGKSWIYTFNPKTELNENTFETRFLNADKIKDRYPRLRVEGKIVDVVKRPTKGQARKLMLDNFQEMCGIVSNVMYHVNNIEEEMHNWDMSKVNLPTRHFNNMLDLLHRIDAYCESQEEFDSFVKYISEAINSYKRMVMEM